MFIHATCTFQTDSAGPDFRPFRDSQETRGRTRIGPRMDEKNEEIIVRKVGQHTLADVHDALFPDGTPKRKASTSLKNGIRKHIRQKYARG